MHAGGRRFSPRRLRPPEWAFWQPGLGGWVFILCQFFGWGLFVASLVALAWMARALASGFAVGFRTLGVGVAALFVVSQVVIGISVLHFQRSKGSRLEAPSAGLPDAGSLQRLLVLLVLYTAPHLLLAFVCLGAAVLRSWAAPAAAGFLSTWYLRRVFDSADAAGRAWPAFERWLERHIDAVAEEWLGGVKFIADWAGSRAPGGGGGAKVRLRLSSARPVPVGPHVVPPHCPVQAACPGHPPEGPLRQHNLLGPPAERAHDLERGGGRHEGEFPEGAEGGRSGGALPGRASRAGRDPESP